jgi:hypothetical protein
LARQRSTKRGYKPTARGQSRTFPVEDAEADADDDEGVTPPTAKKRRVQHSLLMAEAQDRFACLCNAEWSVQCCDKSVEGLLTRISNQRTKMLDRDEPELAAPLTRAVERLGALVEFGLVRKKGYQKSQKESALLALVGPTRRLRELFLPEEQMCWDGPMKQLVRLVEFQEKLAEGQVGAVARIPLLWHEKRQSVEDQEGEVVRSPSPRVERTHRLQHPMRSSLLPIPQQRGPRDERSHRPCPRGERPHWQLQVEVWKTWGKVARKRKVRACLGSCCIQSSRYATQKAASGMT